VKQVLVTGGAGYLGSTLVPLLLSKGYRVRVLDALNFGGTSLLGVWADPQFEFMRGDIRELDTVRKALQDVHAVVHLAAIVGDPACARDPKRAREVNLTASLALLDEAQKEGIARLVFASTCSNYGKMKDPDQYVAEVSELRPVSLYAETKVAVEERILDPVRTSAFCATSLRFATIYGVSPRMRFDLTVNEFTMELVTKRHLVVYGEQFWRPYIHVRDAARAIASVLEQPVSKIKNAVFNVGSTDQNFRKLDLVEMILPYAGDAAVEYVKKAEDPRDYRVSFEKIHADLGFELSRSVKDGIAEVARLVEGRALSDFASQMYRN